MAKLISDHLFPFLSPQGGDSGEEQLCADLPELDLSQLDASDFDSATCFGELQWCPETSETEPSQYSPDDSELFQVSPDFHRPYPLSTPQSPAFYAWSNLRRFLGSCFPLWIYTWLKPALAPVPGPFCHL